MKIIQWSSISSSEQSQALQRPAINAGLSITDVVTEIITKVKQQGDAALLDLTEQFDRIRPSSLRLSQANIDAACARLDGKITAALRHAHDNISRFHQAQIPQDLRVETQTGVVCELISRPIQSVGLYIPGGSAPLPSTVLMLGVPAQIAGCHRTVLCSPPPIADEILYVANLCGIDEVYQIGGAQAVAAMAYGTESLLCVDKIFGPGNAFVTEAKRQVSHDFQGTAIDMPAGPSEVLVIADKDADPDFIAADLLSQAEHGPDSQVILVTPSHDLATQVQYALAHQLTELSRADIAEKALKASLLIIADDLATCVAISNQYGPEHLIVQVENARAWLPHLDNAGSIFLGAWSPESVGDYASGTNHVLPTYGYTRTCSSLSLSDFSKRMTIQELSQDGLSGLASTVITMADAEGLDAHKRAVTIRLDKMSNTQGSAS